MSAVWLCASPTVSWHCSLDCTLSSAFSAPLTPPSHILSAVPPERNSNAMHGGVCHEKRVLNNTVDCGRMCVCFSLQKLQLELGKREGRLIMHRQSKRRESIGCLSNGTRHQCDTKLSTIGYRNSGRHLMRTTVISRQSSQ